MGAALGALSPVSSGELLALSALDSRAASPARRWAVLPPDVFSILRPQLPQHPGERDTEHQSIRLPSSPGSVPAFGGRQEAGARFWSQYRQVAGESGGAHRLRDREPRRGTGVSTTPESAHSPTAPPPQSPRHRALPGAQRASTDPAAAPRGPAESSADTGGARPRPREAAAGSAQPARAHLGPRRRLRAHFRETCGCASLWRRARGGQLLG